MDPDEILAQLRAAVDKADRAAVEISNDAEIEAWQEVGALVRSLDEWISDGGPLPTDWAAQR